MERKKEIEVLQSLKGDTYFNQFFSSQDIDQMCENIKNDFCIELGCQFNKKAEILEKEKREQLHRMNDKIENLVRAMIDSCEGEMNEEMYESLVHEVGKLFIIKYKHQKGYMLTDNEIVYLIEFMDKKIGD